MRLGRFLLLPVLVLAWTAAPAHAQVVASPYLHANFGDVEIRRGGPGMFVGFLGRRLGFEVDADRHQHFYKDKDLEDIPNPCTRGVVGTCIDDDTEAWIFTANVVVPIPTSDASKWRPYGAAGLGAIFAWVHDAGPYDSEQTNPAFNVGGGVMYWATGWFALRSDVRWFHAFVAEDRQVGGYARDYDFGRLLIGVTFAPFGSHNDGVK